MNARIIGTLHASSSMLSTVLQLALAWAVASVPDAAGAQTVAPTDIVRARELGRQGLAALERKDMAAAESKFSQAIYLHAAPTLYLHRAQARRGNNKLLEALDDYRIAARWPKEQGEPAPFASARGTAREQLQELERLTPRWTIVLKGGTGRVLVDGVPYPAEDLGVTRPVNPGEYSVVAITPDGAEVRRRVRMAAGRREIIELQVSLDAAQGAAAPDGSQDAARQPVPRREAPAHEAPPPQPRAVAQTTARQNGSIPAQAPPSPEPTNSSRAAAYITGAAAVVLAIAAVATGVLYLDRRASYLEAREKGEDRRELKDRAESIGMVSNVLLAATAVTGGISLYLFLAPSDEGPAERAGLDFQLGASGRF